MARALDEHVVDTVTGCWRWTAGYNAQGYGQWWNGVRPVLAHVFYYLRLVGPVPEGMELDHLCRVRDCVNPDHLEPVSSRDNTRRGARTKLSPEDVRCIRAVEGVRQDWLAEMFGVAACTISNIRAGRFWKEA
jgi:hypothetical protein